MATVPLSSASAWSTSPCCTVTANTGWFGPAAPRSPLKRSCTLFTPSSVVFGSCADSFLKVSRAVLAPFCCCAAATAYHSQPSGFFWTRSIGRPVSWVTSAAGRSAQTSTPAAAVEARAPGVRSAASLDRAAGAAAAAPGFGAPPASTQPVTITAPMQTTSAGKVIEVLRVLEETESGGKSGQGARRLRSCQFQETFGVEGAGVGRAEMDFAPGDGFL